MAHTLPQHSVYSWYNQYQTFSNQNFINKAAGSDNFLIFLRNNFFEEMKKQQFIDWKPEKCLLAQMMVAKYNMDMSAPVKPKYWLRTSRNTVIRCTLSDVVLREPQLKHYQQQFTSSWLFQLLGAGLSEAVLHVEPLLIILWIISSGSEHELLLIIELSAADQNMNHRW
jgi:hypothetical protein